MAEKNLTLKVNGGEDVIKLKDSLSGMQETIERLKEEYKNLSEIERENYQIGGQLLEDLNKLSQKYSDSSSALKELGENIKSTTKLTGKSKEIFDLTILTLQRFGVEGEKVQRISKDTKAVMVLVNAIQQQNNELNEEGSIKNKIYTTVLKLFNKEKKEETETTKESSVALLANSIDIKANGTEIKKQSGLLGASSTATKTASTATRGFGKALGSTGIGLIIVALGTLITNFDDVKEAINRAADRFVYIRKLVDELKIAFGYLKKGVQIAMDWLESINPIINGIGEAITNYLFAPIKAVIRLINGDFSGALDALIKGHDVIANFKKGVDESTEDSAKKKIAAEKMAAKHKKAIEDKATEEEKKRLEEEKDRRGEDRRNQADEREQDYQQKMKEARDRQQEEVDRQTEEHERQLEEEVKAEQQLLEVKKSANTEIEAEDAKSLKRIAIQRAEEAEKEKKTELQRLAEKLEEKAQLIKQKTDDIHGILTGITGSATLLLDEQLKGVNEKLKEITTKYDEVVAKRKESNNTIEELENEARLAEGENLIAIQERIDQEMAKNMSLAEQEQQLLQNKENVEKDKAKKEKAKKIIEKIQTKIEMGKSIAQATVNIAQGVTKALAFGPILGPILAAIVTAAGIVQIGVMAKQMAKLEDGGLLNGKRHAQGGMRIQGSNIEVEGGEYVINRESTKKNIGLISYINKERRQLGSNDLNTYFNDSVNRSEPSFSRMFAMGGMLPNISEPTDNGNDQILDAIRSIDLQPRVAVTDIIKVRDQMTTVDSWTGM